MLRQRYEWLCQYSPLSEVYNAPSLQMCVCVCVTCACVRIHSDGRPWCVSQVQSLNPSIWETQYLLQLYRTGGTSLCWSFLFSPQGDTVSLRYCIYGMEAGQPPPTPHPPPAAGLLLKVCVRSLVTVLALDQGWVSGCRGRQPQGSCCPRGGRRHLSYGFKGTRGFSFCGVSLHSVKHSCACSSTQSALRFIVIKSSHVWKL